MAARFHVTLEPTHFRTDRFVTRISRPFLQEHPIITGQRDEGRIQELVTNTTCSITSEHGSPIAFLPDTMRNRGKHEAASAPLMYAHCLDPTTFGHTALRGRVVTIADSGFIGNPDTTHPGPGLIAEGDNRLFIERVVRWFAGDLAAPGPPLALGRG